MAWWGWYGWGWRGGWRGWWGPWPGKGPFSHLPPWERPGWIYGRGACWRLYGAPGWAVWWGWYPRYRYSPWYYGAYWPGWW